MDGKTWSNSIQYEYSSTTTTTTAAAAAAAVFGIAPSVAKFSAVIDLLESTFLAATTTAAGFGAFFS
jgi:hypothetical protein